MNGQDKEGVNMGCELCGGPIPPRTKMGGMDKRFCRAVCRAKHWNEQAVIKRLKERLPAGVFKRVETEWKRFENERRNEQRNLKQEKR